MNRLDRKLCALFAAVLVLLPAVSCKKEPADVTGIYFTNIQKGSVSMNEGETFRAKYIVEPHELQETVEIEWTTSKKGVATVKNGRVTAVSVGTAEITATSGSASASFTVKVVPFEVTAFKLQSSVTGYVGEDIPVEVTDIVPEAATAGSIEWSIDKTNVATCYVSGGQLFVKGRTEGVAVLTGKGVGVTHTCQLSFQNYVPVQSVTIDPEGPVTMYYKDLTNIECVVTPAAASLADVTWKVDAPEGLFEEVVENGRILSLKAAAIDGTATVTATAEGKSATIKVKVVTPPLTALSIDEMRLSSTGDFGKKKSASLNVSRTPSNNTSKVIFSSNNTKVATVDENGVVTAVGHGVALIKASADGITAVSLVRCYQKNKITWKLEYQSEYDSNSGDKVYSPYSGQTITTANVAYFRYYDPSASYTDQYGQTKIDYTFYDKLDDIYDDPSLRYTVDDSESRIFEPRGIGNGEFYIEASEYKDVNTTSHPEISEKLTIQPNFGKSDDFGPTFSVSIAFVINSISFYTYSGKLHQTVQNGGTLKNATENLYAVLNPSTSPSFRSLSAHWMYYSYKVGNSKYSAFEGYVNTAPRIKEIGVDATKLKTPSGYNYKVEAVYGYNSFYFYVQ